MNQGQYSYPTYPTVRGARGASAVEARARFIVRTYNHLFLAILAFAGLEVALFMSGVAAVIASAMMGTNWLLILGGFLVAGWVARAWAHRSDSLAMQYLGLAAYVVAEAIIFVPLLYIAEQVAPGTIKSAATVTLVGFGGLTAIAFVTRKDFSFLRGILMWGGIAALVLIVAGVLFGLELGTFFSVAMVALAGAAVLYDTSHVIRDYPQDRYVGAALELFASIALMFWYILRIFISARD